MLTAARIRKTDTTLPQSYRVVFAAEYTGGSQGEPVMIEVARLTNDVAGAEPQHYIRKNYGVIERVDRKVWEWHALQAVG